jgi:hypothetical protein
VSLGKREHPAARGELRAAALRYEVQRAGLADTFLDAVDAAIDSVLDPNVHWGFYRGERSSPQIYSRSVGGFPFDIIFLRATDEVYIIACARERRRPGYWKGRVDI